jgi:tetratricopeptide (TPR) repeat protein
MEHFWPLFYRAMDTLFTNPDLTLDSLAKARELADEAGDAHALLLVDHWTIQTLLFSKRDYISARDLAVRTIVQAVKPIHSNQMERICVHEDLIWVYMGIDPEGYAQTIEDAIRYMENEVTPDLPCAKCLQDIRCTFALNRRQHDEARDFIMQFMSLTEGDAHYHTAAHSDICILALRQGKWEELLTYAEAGQKLAQLNPDRILNLCFFLACQAVAHRKLGREQEAQRAYKQAIAKVMTTTSVPGFEYYNALCAFHEAQADAEAALRVRQRQWKELHGKGQSYREALCGMERVRLMRQLGQPYDEAAAQTRTAIQQLKFPDAMLAELENMIGAE